LPLLTQEEIKDHGICVEKERLSLGGKTEDKMGIANNTTEVLMM
jgi:hypothetical protein